jgi:gamma-glutamyltranspeptidase/glutathione hydrolase
MTSTQETPAMKRAALALAIATLAIASVQGASRHPARGTEAMVAAAHPAATDAGLEMIARGGNAIDAAVAAAFAAGVVEPYSSGIGGGGFMLVRNGETGTIEVIDYRETAPAAATRTMYLDAEGSVIPDASTLGHRAVAVPGTVAGLALAQERHGRLTLSAVLEPAIRLAEEGFPAHEDYVRRAAMMRGQLAADPEAARIFLAPGGEVPAIGAPIIQADLAATLRAVAAEGTDGFYRGRVAKAIAADMAARGGLLTEADLAAYEPRLRVPLRGTYRGLEIVTMPPPSSGGVHLIQMLNILEPLPLAEMEWNSAPYAHTLAETMRMAYADRAEFLGDPAFVQVPVEGLTAKAYAAELRAQIPDGRARRSADVRHGNPARHESEKTTHLCTIDRAGNAVSLTQTINYTFGACVVAPGTGVLLNNEMDDFAAKPGVPNLFGLVGGDANAIEPGKIPLSSMTPTMVLRDGKVAMLLGTPGGSRIITTVLQVFLNMHEHGMTVQEAVDAPRIHHQWLPDELQHERFALSAETRAALAAMGHVAREVAPFCNAMAITVDEATGEFRGAADSRGVGVAKGR